MADVAECIDKLVAAKQVIRKIADVVSQCGPSIRNHHHLIELLGVWETVVACFGVCVD